MRQMRTLYKILVIKFEWKRSLGRPTHSWEDNIKMDLMEIGYLDLNWIHLAQDKDQHL
jgi:hypothetical protein